MNSKSKKEILIVAAILVGVFFLLRSPAIRRHLPSSFAKVVMLGKTDAIMPSIADAALPNVKPVPYPSTSPASIPATLFRAGIWEWNAQNGLLLANGGPLTTQGSSMAKYNVNLSIERQDDTGKMGEGIVSCAKEIHDGQKQCSTGYNFVIIMSGGVPQFAATVNPQLAKLGSQYKLKVIGAVGRSNGEDAFLVPASFKNHPHSIAETSMQGADFKKSNVIGGLLVTGVIRDDDWNIAQKFAADNGLQNNPDEKTFDPDAMNWINSPDYNTAAADFVANKCEDRELVMKGHDMGYTVHVCANATVTWTPGDVVAVTKRGGVVKAASSKDYLMAAVIVGPGNFFSDNRDETTGLLAATFEAGDQARAFKPALAKACDIAAVVYNDDQSADGYHKGQYWLKYALGDTQQGVPLGGSAVYGLEDNLSLFGIKDGKNDDFRSIYNVFAGIDNKEYPSLFKSTPIPSVGDVEVKSYIEDAKDKMSDVGSTTAVASSVNYDAARNGSTLGDRSYSINFATGSAQPLPDGVAVLQQLKDSLAITQAAIEVDGHTDNTGNAAINQGLSQRRAQAVADFLHSAAPSSFPMNRFRVEGFGDSHPVSSNATDFGRAQNRRVEIILKSS